jgi:hypothetical protein
MKGWNVVTQEPMENMTTTFKIQIILRVRVCGLALALILAAPLAFAQYSNMFSSGLAYNTPSMAYAALVQQQMQQNAYFQSQMVPRLKPCQAPIQKLPPCCARHPLSSNTLCPPPTSALLASAARQSNSPPM